MSYEFVVVSVFPSTPIHGSNTLYMEVQLREDQQIREKAKLNSDREIAANQSILIWKLFIEEWELLNHSLRD